MDGVKITDSELLELVKGSGNKAFDILFVRYCQPLREYAMHYMHDRELAKDVVNDVFLKLWMKRDVIANVGNLSAYLHSCVRNDCLDKLKARKIPISDGMLEIADLLSSSANSADELVVKELAAIIQSEIDNLPFRCREIFIRNRRDGMNYDQIAREFDISPVTVRTQMFRAVRILSEKLKKELTKQ